MELKIIVNKFLEMENGEVSECDEEFKMTVQKGTKATLYIFRDEPTDCMRILFEDTSKIEAKHYSLKFNDDGSEVEIETWTCKIEATVLSEVLSEEEAKEIYDMIESRKNGDAKYYSEEEIRDIINLDDSKEN